jgi:hypothetical protein
MNDNNIQIDIQLTIESFQEAIKQATDSLSQFSNASNSHQQKVTEDFHKIGDAAKETGEKVKEGAEHGTGAWNVFKGALSAEVVMKGLEALVEVSKKLFETFVSEGIKASSEYELAVTKLSTSLKLSGNTSQAALEDLKGFALEMQKTTRFAETAVLGVLSFQQALNHLTTKEAKEATKATLDLAAAFGDGENGLAKAQKAVAGVMAGNLSGLSRYKIFISDTGDAAKNTALGLEALRKATEGQAEAQGKTFAGAVRISANAFEDLQKKIGEIITQNPAVMDALGKASKAFYEMADFVKDNSEQIKALVGEVVGGLVNAFNIIVPIVEKLSIWLVRSSEDLKNATIGLGAFTVAAWVYTGAATAAAAATWAALAPLLPLAALFAAVGTAVYFASKYFEELTGAIKILGGVILVTLVSTLDILLHGIQLVVGVLSKDLAQAIENSRKAMSNYADSMIKDGLETIKNAQSKRDLAKSVEEVSKAESLAELQKRQLAEQAAKDKEIAHKKAKKDAEDAIALRTAELQSIVDNLNKVRKVESEHHAEALKLLDKQYRNRQLTYAEFSKQRLDLINDEEAQELAKLDKANEDKSVKNVNYHENQLAIQEKYKDLKLAMQEKEDQELMVSREKALNGLAALSNSKNKEMFMIGKAAAIAEIGISTYRGAIAAYASLAPIPIVGPALGATAAGLLTAYGVERAADTASTQFKYESGGIVPGTSLTGDSIQARVNSGEMILNTTQQTNLFNQLNRPQQSSSQDNSKLEALTKMVGNLLNQPISIQIDGKEIAKATRYQLISGRSLS